MGRVLTIREREAKLKVVDIEIQDREVKNKERLLVLSVFEGMMKKGKSSEEIKSYLVLLGL
jgi:hypothetical protein